MEGVSAIVERAVLPCWPPPQRAAFATGAAYYYFMAKSLILPKKRLATGD